MNPTKNKKASNLDLNEKIREMRARGEEVYHLAFGQSPFPVPECFARSLGEFAKMNEYLPIAGLPELRSEIAAFHKKHENLDVSADQVVVGPGSKELIFLLMHLFEGDILLCSPSWTTYAPQVKLSGRNLAFTVECHRDSGWKVTPDNLKKALENSKTSKRLLIFNNPSNPAGTVYSEKELKEISKVCNENNVLVLSDEIYSRLNFNNSHIPLAKFYPDGTIVTCGFSKWASAGGWRVGYALIPDALKELRHDLLSAASQTYSCVSAPVQAAVAHALKHNQDELQHYLDIEIKVLKRIADFVTKELTYLGVHVSPCGGGFYILPDFERCRSKLRDQGITNGAEMCELLLTEYKVSLMDGSNFMRPPEELTCRLCFVDFDGAEAIKNWNKFADIKDNEKFVQKLAPHVHEGIMRLKTFVKKYS